jgi:hypothetical protein
LLFGLFCDHIEKPPVRASLYRIGQKKQTRKSRLPGS